MSQYYATPRLGVKVNSQQEPGLLGDEHFTVPIETASAGVKLQVNNGNVRVKWFENTSAAAIAPGSVIKRDIANDIAHDVEQCGADEPACAIVDPLLQSDVEPGERFLGVIYGEIDVLAGAAATKGDSLKCDATGRSITNALGSVADLAACYGVLAEDAAAAGDLVKAIVDFRVIK